MLLLINEDLPVPKKHATACMCGIEEVVESLNWNMTNYQENPLSPHARISSPLE